MADEDPRLADLIERASELQQRVSREKQHQMAFAAETLGKAKKLLERHAYDQIIGLVTDVAETVRSDELRSLLALAVGRRDEVLALSGEIRDGVKSGKHSDLMPKLSRMLVLLPSHKQAKQLFDSIRQKLLHSAKKEFARHQYRKAKLLLDRIPLDAQSDECVKLSDEAHELACHVDSLCASPLVDKPLLAITNKLAKVAAGHPHVAKLRRKLKEKMKVRSQDPRAPLQTWARAPKRSHFAFPVDWLGGSRRVTGWAELNSRDHLQQPGSFFVACGLALQALGRAEVAVNLVPREKKGLFDVFTRKKKNGTTVAGWGFDLGVSSLKIVKLVQEGDTGEDLRVAACHRIAFKKHRFAASTESDEREVIQQALKSFLAKNQLGDEPIAVSIRGSRVFGRFFRLPPMEEEVALKAIRHEACNQIPLPIDEMVWDYHMERRSKDSANENSDLIMPRNVTLAAVRERDAREYLRPFQELEMKVEVLQNEFWALYNFAHYEFFANQATSSEGVPGDAQPTTQAIALLDVGSEACGLVVCMPGHGWFRSLPAGGDDFTKAISQTFNLTHEQAEQVKLNPATAPRLSQLQQEFQRIFASLVGQIDRSLVSFSCENPDVTIKHLYTVGGGGQMHGMLTNLRNGAADANV